MMGVIQDIIDSIFTPGTNKSVRIFTCVIFVLLIIVLFGMIFLTNFNIHVIVMFILSVGVFVSLCWFMYELQQQSELNNKDKDDENTSKKTE